MNSSDEQLYWETVVRKLESVNASERGWASQVLATDVPEAQGSNLAFAFKHCGERRVMERVRELASNEADEYAGPNCLRVLSRLKGKPLPPPACAPARSV